MTSSQLILVSVTSALIAVFVMLLVATLKRARSEEREDAEVTAESGKVPQSGGAGTAADKQPATDMPPVISGPGSPGAPDEEAGKGAPRDQQAGGDAPPRGKGGGAKASGAKGGGAKASGAKGGGAKASGAKRSGAKGKGSPSEDGEGAGGG